MVYNEIKETTGFVYGYNEISHLKNRKSFPVFERRLYNYKNEQWYLNL